MPKVYCLLFLISVTYLQPRLTAYAKKCERDGARADGCISADLIRSFRQKFELNVQLAIASGLGGMLLTAGQPFGHDVL